MTAEQFRPTFTTSVEAHEERKEEREEKLGTFFGDRVKTITGTAKPSSPPRTRALKEPPGSLEYDRPYSAFSEEQKALHKESLSDNAPQVFSLTDRQRRMTHKRKKN